MNSKANLRQSIRAKWKIVAQDAALDPAVEQALVQSNQMLNERLIRIFETPLVGSPCELPGPRAMACPSRWAAYQPHSHEPDLQPALLKISSTHRVEFVFPRVQGHEMEFYLPRDEESFLRNHWNLREPDPESSEKIDGSEICGFLIPALAFDQKGRRMGRGRGYFDRYLSRFTPQSKTKIGIAFDDQILVEDLPVDTHDIAMDMVLSERRCLVAKDWLDQPVPERLSLRQVLSAAIPCAEFTNSAPLPSLERTKT